MKRNTRSLRRRTRSPEEEYQEPAEEKYQEPCGKNIRNPRRNTRSKAERIPGTRGGEEYEPDGQERIPKRQKVLVSI